MVTYKYSKNVITQNQTILNGLTLIMTKSNILNKCLPTFAAIQFTI